MKKIFVQIVDTRSEIAQYGKIEEPVEKGYELENALKHFGITLGHVTWQTSNSNDNFESKCGIVDGTTKVINIISMD